jgi:hypothetical protein
MRHNEIKKKVNEGGLADMAQRVEQDHEVQMARSDLYKLAKYSIKLHNMLAMIPETKGIEGWQQAKITKAADYISSVYHNLDYEMKFDQQQVAEKKKSSYKDGLSAMLESKKKSSKVKEENNILDPLRGAAAELFGKPEVSSIPPEEIAVRQAMEKYKDDPAGLKDWLRKEGDLRYWLMTDGNYLAKMVKSHIKGKPKTEEAEVTPGQSLPKQIKVIKMPTPPQAPTGPDGTGDDGTRIGTTPKGNRSVASGAGTYIFTPKGKLMLYMTPKIGGLQQTHNIAKQTVTVNFGASTKGTTIDQKATYDMSGKLISGDNTSIKSGTVGVSVDKDKGATVDMTTLSGKKHSINSKDPKKYDKLAALKKDQDQGLNDFKKANTATLAKMGIKR